MATEGRSRGRQPNRHLKAAIGALGLVTTYGLSSFAMYSFTAMTVFSDWSLAVALTETCWGAFVFAASAAASSYVLTGL
jgi:uncharacterized membrane protein